MKRAFALALTAVTAIGLLASVSSAHAAQGDPWVYKGTLRNESTPGYFYYQLRVNRATGDVLAVGSNGSINQYDSSGNPVEFPATGTNTLPATGSVIVDNSGGPTQGNIYVFGYDTYHAYNPDGSPLGVGFLGPGYYLPREEAFGATYPEAACGLGVDPDGNLWLGSDAGYITEITLTGALTGERVNLGHGSACSPVWDGAGNVYTGPHAERRFDVDDGYAYLGGSGLPLSEGYEIDPVTHEIFATSNNYAKGTKSVVAVAPLEPSGEGIPYEAFSWKFGLEREVWGVAFGPDELIYISEANKIQIFRREPAAAPSDITPGSARQIRAREATLSGNMFSGGAEVTYRFEYGTDTTYGHSTEPEVSPYNYFSTKAATPVTGLQSNTVYHVRLVATNSAGTTYGPDGTIRTYPAALGGGTDPCPNALARKQTVAQRLPDCRAYELASAADTAGYDVESFLAPGQEPFPGFPLAPGRLLYATHSGAVPGPWNATNHGPDPYLATRTDKGWVTNYEGLPSDINPAAGSFSSVLGEADSSLSTLAFAGENLCSPCFTGGGLETGIPVRLQSGQLVQGMSGSQAGSVSASAKPEGRVAKLFSEDGSHLVFASKYAFEPGANTGGSLTVYSRDLGAGTTQIVSTDENGAVLTGAAISELDISGDGSRVVVGRNVSTDSKGNEYVHPYMHIGSSPNGVDLAPGATAGVLYAGMTSDGSRVFFTTTDKLDASDPDSSADLYEAAVDGSGNLDLNILTGPDSNACDPVSNSNGAHWNSTGSTADCSPVAISGGGGVASDSGAVYFLSPEQLDGSKGTLNQPNLYLSQPGGAPKFVATLEPENPLVLDSVKANATRRMGDFQVTPSGGYAAFLSNLGLSALSTHGLLSVYRYAAGSDELDCASCDRTGSEEAGVAASAELPPDGLGLLEDGRLFFTTTAQLLLNDANGRKDVYQWTDGEPALISSGAGPFDSALLGVSADGADVLFFTQDKLAPEEDQNGSQLRIYDARKDGGFFKLPPSVPCQASDECHGPSSPQPPPSDIKSSGVTTRGNLLVCPKNRVKKHGRCVKKKAHKNKRKGKPGRNA
jgi:hypothetical protein